MMDPVTRKILLAFWRVHILHHAREGPILPAKGSRVLQKIRRQVEELHREVVLEAREG